MLVFSLRRLMMLFPVILGVVTIVSLIIHAIPGDPVDQLAGDLASDQTKNELRTKLGLNLPIHQQLAKYFTGIAKFDLGTSLIYKRPVTQLISERIGPTAELACTALIVALLISLPLGIFSAIRAGTKIDFICMTFALIGVSMPNFWLGPMLVLLFSVNLGWLPVSERMGLASYILPSITLGAALAAILTRMTRTAVLEVLNEDYVRTARAKGLPEWRVLIKHVLRNAAIPIVTIVGMQFGSLLTGAIITEKIFDWPGIGTLILDGIGNRDYPLVQGCVLVFSVTYLVVNLLTDLTYAWLDPRIKLGRK